MKKFRLLSLALILMLVLPSALAEGMRLPFPEEIGFSTMFADLPGSPFQGGLKALNEELPEDWTVLSGTWTGYECEAFAAQDVVFAIIARLDKQRVLLLGTGAGAQAAVTQAVTRLPGTSGTPELSIKSDGDGVYRVQWVTQVPDKPLQTIVAVSHDSGTGWRLGSVTTGDMDMDAARLEPMPDGSWRLIQYERGEPVHSVFLRGKKLSDDLTAFNPATFPGNLKAAQKASTTWYTVLPEGSEAPKAKMASGNNWPVYTGPDEKYFRANNNKATVSTNGPVQVNGWENGWINVAYQLTNRNVFRRGYVRAQGLRKGAVVVEVTHSPLRAYAIKDTVVTDDLVIGKSYIADMSGNSFIYLLKIYNEEYAYLEGLLTTGEPVRGYVPIDAIALNIEDADIMNRDSNPVAVHFATKGDGTHFTLQPFINPPDSFVLLLDGMEAAETKQDAQGKFPPAVVKAWKGTVTIVPVNSGVKDMVASFDVDIPPCWLPDLIGMTELEETSSK